MPESTAQDTLVGQLNSRPLLRLRGLVGPAFEVGTVGGARRRIVPITGGDFEGDRLRGEVVPFGADWMHIREDGVLEVDVRALLRTDDDALIYLRYGGYRHGPADVMASLARGEDVDPAAYYFRVTPTFETGASRYAWLNNIIAVGVGRKNPEGPVYDFFEVL